MVLSLTLKSLPLIGSIFLLLFFLLKVEKSFDREPQQNFVSGYGGMRCLLQIRPIILKPFFLLIRTFALIIFFNRYRTEKKYSPQDCVSLREHFAPRLFLQRFSFLTKLCAREFEWPLTLRRPLQRSWRKGVFYGSHGSGLLAIPKRSKNIPHKSTILDFLE